jgi:hypothetical protein
VCCSLVSNTNGMDRSGELSDFKRELVTGCCICNNSVRDIATLLKLPKSMVDGMIVKWKRESTIMKPGLDRPRLMTDRGRRALKNEVREPLQTSSETLTREFRSAMHCPASTVIVRRQFRGRGFHGQAAAHKPNISPVIAKRCSMYHVAVRWEALRVTNAWRTICQHV